MNAFLQTSNIFTYFHALIDSLDEMFIENASGENVGELGEESPEEHEGELLFGGVLWVAGVLHILHSILNTTYAKHIEYIAYAAFSAFCV